MHKGALIDVWRNSLTFSKQFLPFVVFFDLWQTNLLSNVESCYKCNYMKTMKGGGNQKQKNNDKKK